MTHYYVAIEHEDSVIEYFQWGTDSSLEEMGIELSIESVGNYLLHDVFDKESIENFFVGEEVFYAKDREELIKNMNNQDVVFLYSSYGWSIFDGNWENLAEYLGEDFLEDDDELFDNLDTIH